MVRKEEEESERRTDPLLNLSRPAARRTALHWAAKRGHERVARALLQYGADATVKDAKGHAPVDVASESVRPILGGGGGMYKAHLLGRTGRRGEEKDCWCTWDT
jgi:hypothetical protein